MGLRVLTTTTTDTAEALGLAPEELYRVPPTDVDDGAATLAWALNRALEEGADWTCLGNDHTFYIPENLLHYLSSSSSFRDPSSNSHWVGHLLKEGGGDQGALFMSGAAGHCMSSSLLRRLLEALDSASVGSCRGSKRERSQPGLLLAKCILSLGVSPVDASDPNGGAALFHVYGPVRLVTRRVDDWWQKYRKNAGVAVNGGGSECCSGGTITFHYAFAAEQRLLDDVLRRPDRYRGMSPAERWEEWPKQARLGGYSYPPRTLEESEQVFALLLEKVRVADYQEI